MKKQAGTQKAQITKRSKNLVKCIYKPFQSQFLNLFFASLAKSINLQNYGHIKLEKITYFFIFNKLILG